MKKSASLLLYALIAFSCNNEKSNLKSDLKIANLKGNVWRIDRTIHESKEKCGCVMKIESNESKYVYDTKGNLVGSYSIDENGNISDSTRYIYNRKGICAEITRFRGKNSAGKEVPVFEKGKVTGVKTFDENGKIESTLTYIYSGEEISEEKTLDSNGEIVSTRIKEYLNGQLSSETEKDNNGNILNISKFNRNNSNDIIECLYTVPKDSMEYRLTYEYEYDATGNWIKQTEFYDNQIVDIVVRNIEYYNN